MNAIIGIRNAMLGAVCLTLSVNCFCLEVTPASATISGLELGENRDTGLEFTVKNDSEGAQEFSLEAVLPDITSGEAVKVYNNIPVLNWVYFDRPLLFIPAKSSDTSKVHVRVPSEDKYYNQHWAVACHVKQKGGSFVNAADSPLLLIETKSKADVTENPYGEFGVAPGTVGIRLEDLKKKKTSFTVYNNGSKDCVFKIKGYIPDPKALGTKIALTKGFEWINERQWVKTSLEDLRLRAGESKEVELEINLPGNLNIPATAAGLEALVLVESEKNEYRFVRIVIVK